MHPLAILFFVVAAVSLLSLPRQSALLPLMAGTCLMPIGTGIEIGPVSLPVFRLLILAGFIRVMARGERPAGGLTGLDKCLLLWGAWFTLCSFFHVDARGTMVTHLGLVLNTVGTYFLLRCLCNSADDVQVAIRTLAMVLVPVAIEMASERFTGRNFFSIFGGVPDSPIVRNGRLRAQGPFGHPILAGTVGGTSFPLMFAIWRSYPLAAKAGLISCALMVLSSAASGPIMSVVFGGLALVLWRWHSIVPRLRVLAVVGYLLADIVMNDPAYFLLARIDLTGSSAGYHRAALIQSSFNKLDEWWFAGTDYTRHWMPYGVSWSEDHADITNHYIGQGVKGGLPLMCLFILVLAIGFSYVRVLVERPENDGLVSRRFMAWVVGASLFSHATSLISVAYFDQCVFFLYFNLAALGSMRASVDDDTPEQPVETLASSDLGEHIPIEGVVIPQGG
jgi:hypothetical protein